MGPFFEEMHLLLSHITFPAGNLFLLLLRLILQKSGFLLLSMHIDLTSFGFQFFDVDLSFLLLNSVVQVKLRNEIRRKGNLERGRKWYE